MTLLGIFLAILIGIFLRSVVVKKFWGNRMYRTPWWVIIAAFILSAYYSPSAVYGLIGLFSYDILSYAMNDQNKAKRVIKPIHEYLSKGVSNNVATENNS